MTKKVKECPDCNLIPVANLEVSLDPVVCFAATIKCKECLKTGPTFDKIESKSVKDLIQPAVELWNASIEQPLEKPQLSVGEELNFAIDNWLKENE
jgi:hypothetical protein